MREEPLRCPIRQNVEDLRAVDAKPIGHVVEHVRPHLARVVVDLHRNGRLASVCGRHSDMEQDAVPHTLGIAR